MSYTIAMISEHASPLAVLGSVDSGGQNVYVYELSRQLAELGHHVDVFTRWDDAQLSEVITLSEFLRVIHIEAGPKCFVRKEELLSYMNSFTEQMTLWIQKQHYDLVHANFFMSGLVAADIKRLFNIPFVITFHALGKVRKLHQEHLDEFPETRFSIEQHIIDEADGVIAECPQDYDDLVEHYKANPNTITIVPCGVRSDQFEPMSQRYARRQLGLPLNSPIILQLGRLVRRKGIDNVIRSLALLQTNLNPFLLIVGGNATKPDPTQDPELKRLMNVAEEIKVLDKIKFVGQRTRNLLRYYYSAADVFVSTPWYEPFGITPLEAMACGTPVIGSNVGGIKYTIVDGETGYLVPPKNPLALATKLKLVLEQPRLKAQMGQAGLRRVQDRFTWGVVAQEIIQLYNKIAAQVKTT
jgi:D-inositol-3-phosphate glycosyltransferase